MTKFMNSDKEIFFRFQKAFMIDKIKNIFQQNFIRNLNKQHQSFYKEQYQQCLILNKQITRVFAIPPRNYTFLNRQQKYQQPNQLLKNPTRQPNKADKQFGKNLHQGNQQIYNNKQQQKIPYIKNDLNNPLQKKIANQNNFQQKQTQNNQNRNSRQNPKNRNLNQQLTKVKGQSYGNEPFRYVHKGNKVQQQQIFKQNMPQLILINKRYDPKQLEKQKSYLTKSSQNNNLVNQNNSKQVSVKIIEKMKNTQQFINQNPIQQQHQIQQRVITCSQKNKNEQIQQKNANTYFNKQGTNPSNIKSYIEKKQDSKYKKQNFEFEKQGNNKQNQISINQNKNYLEKINHSRETDLKAINKKQKTGIENQNQEFKQKQTNQNQIAELNDYLNNGNQKIDIQITILNQTQNSEQKEMNQHLIKEQNYHIQKGNFKIEMKITIPDQTQNLQQKTSQNQTTEASDNQSEGISESDNKVQSQIIPFSYNLCT